MPFVLGGLVALALTLFADPLRGLPFDFGLTQSIGVLVALGIVALSFLPDAMRLKRAAGGLCVAFLSLVLGLFVAEALFRAVGYDFAHWEERKKLIPPFFLLPDDPLGDGLFKRRGPLEWSGRVLYTRVSQLGIAPNPYADETPIVVSYDRDGFRNPSFLDDWEVVVTGDSFTELGYLPHEKLTTSVLARELDLRVKNLGVCATSLLSQLAYLERFGLAPSTRHAVVAFFEGNDLSELHKESERMKAWRAGERNTIGRRGPQPSLVQALSEGLPRILRPAGPVNVTDATFLDPDGEIPLTVIQTPPDPSGLPSEWKEELGAALERYVSFAEQHELVAWLAYLPCKLRVHRERLRFTERAEQRVRLWEPTDLASFVRELCEQRGILFVDATPALRAEAEATGELLFNTIYDTHLNARGAEIVGREWARAMGEVLHAGRQE